MTQSYVHLLTLIASHPGNRVVGRKRLQKTVYLLQRLGFPSQYDFKLFFYGPYSEAVQADTALLVSMGLLVEEEQPGEHGPYYEYTVNPAAGNLVDPPQVKDVKEHLRLLGETGATVLELAATYDTFRELGYDHGAALAALREEKGSKCTSEREAEGLALLTQLGLPSA